MKKAKKQDILDELLINTGHAMLPEVEELISSMKHRGDLRGESGKDVRSRPTRKREKKKTRTKKKTTHYLSVEIFAGLDEAKEKIRQIVPPDIKTTVSKSKIVNHALKMILQDFETNGKSSSLVKLLLSNSQQPTEK